MWLILLLLPNVSGFITYPFTAAPWLDQILHAFPSKEIRINQNLISFAVPGEECFRKCSSNDRRVCYFKFRLEVYTVLGGACFNCTRGMPSTCLHPQCVTADGIERGLITVNRQLPGPPIQVCIHDTVMVDVTNHMDGAGTSIHWHGMTQKGSPFSDGVPFLTQCPINSGNTFRYVFNAKNAGTYFYHSHSGLQKADGLYGAIIVRIPEEPDLYDHDDFVMVLSDWMHDYAAQFFPGLPSTLSLYKSILINGRAAFYDSDTKTYANMPLMTYNVQSNKRYRFRIINAGSNVCAFLLTIENHNLKLIASDGSSFKPVDSKVLHITAGERYDLVIETNQKPRDYLIRVKSYLPCKNFQGNAILRYHKKPVKTSNTLEFVNLNDFNMTDPVVDEKTFNSPVMDGTGVVLSQVKGALLQPDVLTADVDEEFYMFIETPVMNNSILFDTENTIKFMMTSTVQDFNNIATINNISFIPPHFTLLSEPEKVKDEMFCDKNTKMTKDCLDNISGICHCVHRIKVKLNSIIELVMIDIEDSQTHPFHLHGHKFYVMEMGSLNMTVDDVKKFGIPRKLPHNPSPTHKDTVLVPNGGYVRLRLKADNPGFWLAHCHFEWHLAIGMAFILQVGEVEEMKKPPYGYEKCNSFKPNKFV